MMSGATSKIGKEAIQQILELLIELLVKMKILPKSALENKKQIAETVADFMESNGMDLKNADLKKPEVKNTMCTALTIVGIGNNSPGAKMTLDTYLKVNRSPEQNAKLTLGLAYINVMQKNPQLKLDMDLIFKDSKDMTAKDKEKLSADLAIVFVASNEKEIDLKLGLSKDDLTPEALAKVAPQVKAVMDELENPGSTREKILAGEKDKTAMKQSLFGGGNGPIVANAMGVPDMFPEIAGFARPIDMLSGKVLTPSQAATGLRTEAEDRDIAAGIGDNAAEEKDVMGAPMESKAEDPLASLSSLVGETASDTKGADPIEQLHTAIDKTYDDNGVKTHNSPALSRGGAPH